MKWIASCLLIVLLTTVPSMAQRFPAPGEQIRIYLITFGPGSDPWEKFGHNAIVVQDPYAGTDVSYNWGVFDFGNNFSGNIAFGWHFLQGRLLYSMRSWPTEDMLETYKSAGRSIVAQELNLTPAQKLDLQARLMANDTDANRYYLYDYFTRNCATMARDAIDQTVNGRVHTALVDVPTGTTYRWQDRRATADVLWLYVFLDESLGHPVDQQLSAWEESFLPGRLAQHLLTVRVVDADGQLVPLIRGTRQVNAGVFPERVVPPASFFYWFLAAGCGGGIVIFLLGVAGRTSRWARWFFGFVVSIWSLLAGTLGVLGTFVWFTNHAAAKWNENWFHCNPLSVLLIVLAPAAGYWPNAARKIAFIVLGLSAFGLIAKITPWFWQSNGSIIAFALPMHAGVAWGISRRTNWKLQPMVPVEKKVHEYSDAA